MTAVHHAKRSQLDAMMATMSKTGGQHWLPLLEAVKAGCIALFTVPRGRAPFDMPETVRMPCVAIIGDDYDDAIGPSGFHIKSLRALVKTAHATFIMAGAPDQLIYASAACIASITGLINVVLIETRPCQAKSWADFIERHAS